MLLDVRFLKYSRHRSARWRDGESGRWDTETSKEKQRAVRVSNEAVRRRAKVHTVESVLRQGRLLMMKIFVQHKHALPQAASLGETCKGCRLDEEDSMSHEV